jgi:aminoglycoside phosphotransferase (APT) family kinase protein
MGDVNLEQGLERFLRARIEEAQEVKVVGLRAHSEGFSQETFSFDAELALQGHTERRSYVAKREPEAGLLEPYDLEPEFRVLHALTGGSLCSPPTLWFERDPAVLTRPFYVMERLPGDAPVPGSRPDGSPPFSDAERAALAPEVVAALARIHAIDWRAQGLEFLGAPEPGPAAAGCELARWEERIRRSELAPEPLVSEALLWLRRHVPATAEITLVHGDFRLGNWLVEQADGAARLTGVLDWELVHLGDPLEDVAWCASPMWRARTPYAGALLPEADFLDAYARATGRKVDAERLQFYTVLSVVKMIAIELTGIHAFLEGRTGDLRMAIFDHQIPFLQALLAVLRGWLPETVLGGS